MCFSRNFLELNIYMRDLRVQEFKQLKAYTLFDLLSKSYLPCKINKCHMAYVTNFTTFTMSWILIFYMDIINKSFLFHGRGHVITWYNKIVFLYWLNERQVYISLL